MGEPSSHGGDRPNLSERGIRRRLPIGRRAAARMHTLSAAEAGASTRRAARSNAGGFGGVHGFGSAGVAGFDVGYCGWCEDGPAQIFRDRFNREVSTARTFICRPRNFRHHTCGFERIGDPIHTCDGSEVLVRFLSRPPPENGFGMTRLLEGEPQYSLNCTSTLIATATGLPSLS